MDDAEPPAETRSLASPDAESDGPGVRYPPPFVYVALGGLAWWLDIRWPLRPPAELEGVLDPLGFTLLAAGLALDLSSLALFWRQRTSPLPFRPASAFVVRGAYRFTRNPMYLGMTMLVAGIGLLVEKLGLVVAAFAAAVVLDRFVIPREERHLEARFGASYAEYRRRVRRWI